mmetsp:Transcript_7006/g.5588  ORF Transcript_7006/g.5588 Transcript_7006/m.5588 type:complete len:126 (-) Transcript_7006:15-392(-)
MTVFFFFFFFFFFLSLRWRILGKCRFRDRVVLVESCWEGWLLAFEAIAEQAPSRGVLRDLHTLHTQGALLHDGPSLPSGERHGALLPSCCGLRSELTLSQTGCKNLTCLSQNGYGRPLRNGMTVT